MQIGLLAESTRNDTAAAAAQAGFVYGKPVHLRVGRTTVVKLPSGEEVALEPARDNGHLVLRITAPEGSEIGHRKAGGERSAIKGPSGGAGTEGPTPITW